MSSCPGCAARFKCDGQSPPELLMKTLSPLAKSSAQSRSEPKRPILPTAFAAGLHTSSRRFCKRSWRSANPAILTRSKPIGWPITSWARWVSHFLLPLHPRLQQPLPQSTESRSRPPRRLRMSKRWRKRTNRRRIRSCAWQIHGFPTEQARMKIRLPRRRSSGERWVPHGHLAPSVPHRYRISRRDPSLIPARALCRPGQLFRPVGLAAPPYDPGPTEPAARHEAKSVSPLFSVNQKDAVSRSLKSLAPKWSLPLAQISE